MTEVDSEKFNVVQYIEDDWHEYVPNGRRIEWEAAGRLAMSYATRPAAQMGVIKRVIITDGGDHIAWQWEYGKGITYGYDPAKGEFVGGDQ